jgi:hypothetical protein
LGPKTEISKYRQLKQANLVGLNIPPTIISNDRNEIEKFLKRHKGLVSKPVGDIAYFDWQNELYSMSTKRVTHNVLDFYDVSIFPAIVQKEIPKEFEVRSFVLGDEIYSMAIFSQTDSRTELDFRLVDFNKPNRMIPFNLDLETSEKLMVFMKSIDANSGSVDWIIGKDGKTYFLEVNLKDITSDSRFQTLWSVSKDLVQTCKDCEFRYNCLDCRVYTKGEGNEKLEKPAKCKYDPYTSKWINS